MPIKNPQIRFQIMNKSKKLEHSISANACKFWADQAKKNKFDHIELKIAEGAKSGNYQQIFHWKFSEEEIEHLESKGFNVVSADTITLVRWDE